MSDVKSYDYVFNYFSNSGILVEAIKEYHKTAKIPKGEYTLLDLLKKKCISEAVFSPSSYNQVFFIENSRFFNLSYLSE